MSPKKTSRFLIRIFFGLALFFVGIAHYRTAADFAKFVGTGLPGPLEQVGMVWGYILPALMIVGGLLYVVGKFSKVAVWTVGIALGSIAAGILMKSALSSAVSLGDTMPGAVNAFTWILIYLLVSKAFCCGCSCKDGKCACGTGSDCKGCHDDKSMKA